MRDETLLTPVQTAVQVLWVESSGNWSVFIGRPQHRIPREGSGSLSICRLPTLLGAPRTTFAVKRCIHLKFASSRVNPINALVRFHETTALIKLFHSIFLLLCHYVWMGQLKVTGCFSLQTSHVHEHKIYFHYCC